MDLDIFEDEVDGLFEFFWMRMRLFVWGSLYYYFSIFLGMCEI